MIFCSTFLRAQGFDSIADQLHLTEVTVTAARRTQSITPLQTLEGRQLFNLSSHSVADALRYFSGIQLKDYGGVGGLKTVDIRSMGTHHLGVFYDGIEIGNAQNGVVDLGKFSLENIDQITLYNGQKADIFQSAKEYGSAGNLYLQSRRPQFQQGKNYNLTFSMKAGTFGLANPSAIYEQRLTDNLHLSANLEYMYAHGRYHFRYRRLMPDHTVAWDTTAVRQNGDINALRAELGLYGYLPDGKWHAKGYFYSSEKGIPGAIVNNVFSSAQRQWDRNAFCQASYNQTLIDGYDILLSAKYSNDYLHYLNPDTTLLYTDNHFLQQEIYFTTANRLHLSGKDALISSLRHSDLNWDINLSADWQLNILSADLNNFSQPMRHSLYVAAATALNYRWFRTQASLLASYFNDHTHINSQTTQRFTLSPAAYISYQPYLPEQLFIRAFFKRNWRMPTFNDLYYTDIGSITLLPEQCTQYDGGIEYQKTLSQNIVRQFSIRADGYFNQIHNKIVAIPKGNSQYRWMMLNLGYVEIRGLDLNASIAFALAKELTFSAIINYTYQQAQDFTDPQEITYGGQIAYIPWHSGSVAATLAWRNLSVNYSFIYVGERYHNSANIPQNYEQPWYTHDLSLNYELLLSKIRLNFAIEINNMLNQQYEVILNYPMPGINGKGIIRIII